MNATSGSTRILMTADAVGGIWVFSTWLARRLSARGYDVHLVVLGPAPRQNQLQVLRGSLRVTVTSLDVPLEWMDPDGRGLKAARTALERVARKYAPDLVHLNGFREAVFDWRAPTLITAHSCVNSWWQSCRNTPPPRSEWEKYTQGVRAGLVAADCWVAPSATMRDWIGAIYNPPRAGSVILNGIEPARPHGRSRHHQILAAGRLWDEAKNIAALDSVSRHVDWPIRIAGPVEAPGRSFGHKGQHTLDILGELPRDRLLREMSRSEIYLAPALYEPFGLTVLEAAAAGCALVLADIPTFRELWDGAAIFADPRSPDEIGAALKTLITDTGLRCRLQKRARQRARTYTLDQTVDGYTAIYEHLLRNCPTGSTTQGHVEEAAP